MFTSNNGKIFPAISLAFDGCMREPQKNPNLIKTFFMIAFSCRGKKWSHVNPNMCCRHKRGRYTI